MPLPKRRKDESKSKFKKRCMGDSVMKKEFPDEKQRFVICSKLADKTNEVVSKCSEVQFGGLFGNGINHIDMVLNRLNVGEYQYKKFNDKEYLVVPVTIIVEGVHNYFFYPAEDLKSNYMDWEGVLIPIYHPQDEDGNFLSANEIEGECLGRLWNPVWDENKKGIRGEFWLERDKLTDEIIEEIINGNMEVSTGLWADHDFDQNGIWEGEPYIATLSNYIPDHVALLPGHEGACNWEDGCGIRNNIKLNRKEDKNNINNKEVEMDYELISQNLKNIPTKKVLIVSENKEDYSAMMKIYEENGIKIGKNKISINELSHEDIRFSIQSQVRDAFKTPDNEYPDVWVRDVFNSYYVFDVKGRLYKQNYNIDSDDILTLEGDVKEVKLKSEYVELSSSQTESTDETSTQNITINIDGKSLKEALNRGEQEIQNDNEEDLKMKKEELINALIENENAPYEEEDREHLNSKDEEKLIALNEKFKVDTEPDPTVNDEDNNTVSEEVQNLVKQILENDKNTFTEEQLLSKEQSELENLINVMGSEEKVEDEVPSSAEEYLEKSDMPDDMKEVFRESLSERNERKMKMVDKIMANEKNSFSKEGLEKKNPKELGQIIALMGGESENNTWEFNLAALGINDKGKEIPIAPKPKWNQDGTPDFSHFSN